MKPITNIYFIFTMIFTGWAHANTPSSIKVSGVEKHSSLDQVSTLWQSFEQANYLHSTLNASPTVVYVFYDAFDKSYQQADILIGYDVADLTRYKHSESIPFKEFTSVLTKSHYTKKQLSDAWKTFDYRKKVKAVLEVHTLATLGNKAQTALYVLY